MKDLIGRKVRGFKFGKSHACGYIEEMDKYNGEEGRITSLNSYNNSFAVCFDDGRYWSYPASEIKPHLVDEWVVGEEYEFSDDDTWCKGKLLAIVNHRYKHISLINNACGTLTAWKHIRHIQPQVNELTLEDIAEKFGVSVESIKIKK